MLSLLVSFVAFPESKDAILSKVADKSTINVDVSGSLGFYHDNKCHKTFGNETLVSDAYSEWCSNIATDKNDPLQNPWIQYSIKGKQMKISRYSVRNGCCHFYCCCTEENGKIVDYQGCCCDLYSYSLHGSNDNKTWTLLHKVENDKTFEFCATKTFEIKENKTPYTFLRFVLDQEWPNCQKCMQINQIEFYGETVSSSFSSYGDYSDDDESISIIGRIKKGE